MTVRSFEFRQVTKTFDASTAVADLTFGIVAGSHTALLGPSGCGKTTALRLLAGLETPTAGEVRLDGAVVSADGRVLVPPHNRHLTMVFQDLALWPNLTVAENVSLGLAGLRLPRATAASRAREALELCRIPELSRRRPGELSGGQQQRAALARAIAPRPAFIILDEPFTGLDLVLKSQLSGELLALAARWDITLVMVTHDPSDALAMCRTALVLQAGRLLESGDLRRLIDTSDVELFRVFRDGLSRTTSSPPA